MSELSGKGLKSGTEQKTTKNQIVGEEIIIMQYYHCYFLQLKSPTNYATAVPVRRIEVK